MTPPPSLRDRTAGAELVPSLLTPGVLGADRATAAWTLTKQLFLENPLQEPLRTALLCAAWERPGGAAHPIHATGMSLLGQRRDAEPLDLAGTWRQMASHDNGRRLLRATVALGQRHAVPDALLMSVLEDLDMFDAAWQDLMAFSTWAEGLYHATATTAAPVADERLEPWLGRVVQAGPVLADLVA